MNFGTHIFSYGLLDCDNYHGRDCSKLFMDSRREKMKIALIGTRGVPANYGGFETCAEEVGARLAKNHEVFVYCRKGYYKKFSSQYKGMYRILLPNLKRKSLDTISHTILSVFHALFQRYDACVVFNAANSFWLLPLRFFGKKIIINTDGLEWKRSKWGFLGKTYYRLAEIMACLISDRLISDCDGIRNYYLNKHQTDSTVIAYGAYVQECPLPKKLDQFGVQPSEYFLQITRFEPENHPLLTIQAFKKLKTDKKLILVGGVHYPSEYSRQMKEAASGCDNIILPGYVYDQELLRELWCCCHAYIHGNSVGGTNPALLQAMASGCFVLCVDVAFNRDVLKECGIFYKSNTESLVEQMQWTIDRQEELDSCRFMAVKRIELHYSWDSVAKEYETLCEDVVRGVYRWKPTVKPLLPSNKNL